MQHSRFDRHIKERVVGNMGNWRIYKTNQDYQLWHYDTLMLEWHDHEDGEVQVIYRSLGKGSVTDQQMMNAAFDVLGLPIYYSRKGGAHYVDR